VSLTVNTDLGGQASVADAGQHNRKRWPARRPAKLDTKATIYRTGLLLAFLLVWEAAATWELVDVRFVSKPSDIIAAMGPLSGDPAVRQALLDTIVAVAVSFVIGSAIGLLLGLALGLNRTLHDAYMPVLVMLVGIPKSVFLPLMILFFGLGNEAGMAFGVLLAFLQVAVNVVAGVGSIPKQSYEVARSYGAGPVRLFLDVILPGAAPGLFAGLWHGIRTAFIGVVIVQMFVSTVGIGYLVRVYTNIFRVDQALAVVIIVALVIIVTGVAWGRLERRLTRWRGEEETSL
jgi:ABC-type nitrate/sulfonate/bicarbonate transport system permease component